MPKKQKPHHYSDTELMIVDVCLHAELDTTICDVLQALHVVASHLDRPDIIYAIHTNNWKSQILISGILGTLQNDT